ncbi:MAG: ABC transporter permease [Aggregatilineales bacterium]
MTKFVLRRILQSIPTLIGITLIAYFIMDIVPGNPLSQITLDPNLSPEQRTAIFEANGFNDPFFVKYFRWLTGDAPYTINQQPSWSVEMNNGETVIVNATDGNVAEIRTTDQMRGDLTDTPIRRGQSGEQAIDADAAQDIALGAVTGGDVSVVEVGWLPFYDAFVIWEGRQLPIWRSGEIIGEEPGLAGGVLRGDFGNSYVSKRPTTEAIGIRIGATFELGAISLIVGLLIGIPVGVLAAVWQGGIFDQITRIGAVLVSAIPVFWLGLILLLVFGSWLQVLPMGNRYPISFSGDYTLAERIEHLILPVFTLSSFTIATFSRFMRASLLNVLNEDYVRTARAKGLSNRKVWFKHALRNAMIPIATILGPSLTGVLSGAILTETIYSWPGMGTLVVNSVTQQDYPVIMGVVLIFAVLTVLGYLISDILYAVFDPRIRLG